MHSGGMNHPITVQRRVQMGLLDLGDPNYVWQTFLEPFAEVNVVRGREHFDQQSHQRYSEDVWHFRCHYEDVVGIDASMRVVDEFDQAFDIKSIRPDAESRQDCIIECTAQDATIGAAALSGFIDENVSAGEVGEVYDGFAVQAKGGAGPYSFAVTSGALPNGLTLNGATGLVAGTPTVPGSYAPIITVTDVTGATHVLPRLSITVTVDEAVSWVRSGSLWDADYLNSKFRDSAGNIHSDETDFNAAMGGQKSGITRTYGPFVTGDNIFPDGDIASTSGWAATVCTLTNPGGVLRMTATSTTGARLAEKTFASLTGDTAYLATAEVVGAGGLNGSLMSKRIYISSGGTTISLFPATLGSRSVVFSALGTAVKVGARWDGTGDNTSYVDYDEFTLRSVIPYPGYVAGGLSGQIDFVVPVTVPSTQVLAQWGNTAQLDYVRVELGTDFHLWMRVARNNGGSVADIDLGVLVAGSTHTIKLAATTNRFSVSLDGAPIATDTAGIFPGCGVFYVGKSPTGEAWTGSINRATVWAEALSDVALVSPFKAMIVWGDSLATATGASVAANAWWNLLAADLGWTVVSKGVGGNDTSTELGRFNSEAEPAYDSWINIFIDRPNTGELAADWLSNIGAMAALVSVWYVVPPLINSASGVPDTSGTAVNAIKAALLSGSWVGHSLGASAQASLQTTMDSDSTRVVAGADYTHFSDAGHAAVKASIKAGLQAVGLA